MIKRARNVMHTKPMSIDELVAFCNELKNMEYRESVEYGKSRGITHNCVEALRKMLGYSDGSSINKLTPDQRDAIADEYREGDVTMTSLAKKYGVTYNAVRCLLVNRDVTIVNPNSYTKRQELYILNEIKRGTPVKNIAEAMGRSERSIKQKIERMEAKKHAA